jgi:hypothetical protein
MPQPLPDTDSDARFIRDYLHRLRTQFYPDDEKAFYQQRNMLIDAITTPARWLHERGVRLPDTRLRDILDTIIRTIQHHGNTSQITYFCRYFLHSVQQHMTHHGETYYNEAKSLRTILATAVEHLTRQQKTLLPAAQDQTTTRLAELNRLVRQTTAARRRRTKATPKTSQGELF